MPEPENYPNAPYLTVADPKRSIRFYKGLGFALGNAWPSPQDPQYASLVLDRQVLMVGASYSEKEAKAMGAAKAEVRRMRKEHKAFKKHRHGVGVQLYLKVPDPDAHHRAALRRKVEVLREPTTHFYGIRDYVAVDPDGYQLVFFAAAEANSELAPAPRKKARRKQAQEQAAEEPAPTALPTV